MAFELLIPPTPLEIPHQSFSVQPKSASTKQDCSIRSCSVDAGIGVRWIWYDK